MWLTREGASCEQAAAWMVAGTPGWECAGSVLMVGEGRGTHALTDLKASMSVHICLAFPWSQSRALRKRLSMYKSAHHTCACVDVHACMDVCVSGCC